jgi:hypothetical protein
VKVRDGFVLKTPESDYDLFQAGHSEKNLMNTRLLNKRALFTGGSRGIGVAIVKCLTQETGLLREGHAPPAGLFG